MRTDAKVGFAIGGVLLAVIVVYLLVVPRHHQAAHPGVALVTPSGSSGSSGAPAASDSTNSENTNFNAGASLDKFAPPAPPATPPMSSELPGSLTPGSADSSKMTPGPVASSDGKADGSNWEKLFAGSTQTPGSTPGAVPGSMPIDGSHPLAGGSTPLPAAAGARGGPGAAGAALNGGMSTLNADHSTTGAMPRHYTIEQGQTLSSIAATVYGNSRYYVAIAKANPSLNPNRMRPGTRIVLPDISDVKPAAVTASADSGANVARSLDSSGAAGGGVILASEAAPPTETVVAGARVYAVQKGDTLYRISKRLYGTTAQAKTIYSLNQDVIGPNAAKLKLGMILRLPDGDTAGS
jgi:LysM repeat protein